MKQYLPAITSAVLALVFSGFSYAERSAKVFAKANSNVVSNVGRDEVPLYWHPVDPSSGLVYGLPAGPAYKSSMIGGSCLDQTTVICYYGSDIYEDLRNIYVGDVIDAFRLVRESY